MADSSAANGRRCPVLAHAGRLRDIDYPLVTADGQLGPRTLATYQALERKRRRIKACELTLKLIDAQQASHYMQLHLPTFVVGWVDHRVGNVALARCAESVATSKDQS